MGNFRGADPKRTYEEEAHFGLWTIVSSPLILGFNMSSKSNMDRVWGLITNQLALVRGLCTAQT